MNCTDLAEERQVVGLMNQVMSLRFNERGGGNFLTTRGPVTFTGRALHHGVN